MATSCHAPARPVAPPRAPSASAAASAPSAATLEVLYREPANVFEILDNVASWRTGKADPAYREHWRQRYGLGAADDERFASYKEIRKRYISHADDLDGGLFARTKPADTIAETFYAAATLDAAFTSLATFVSADDVATLRAFYEAYRPQLAPLLVESKAYVEIAATLQGKLESSHAADYYARVARYYGAPEAQHFSVLYVWWPPVDSMTANQHGPYLLLKYNPVKHRADAERATDVTVHELVHYVSGHQPEAQKLALTKTFLAGCDVTAAINGPRILEEPLAVVHQKIFLGLTDPEHLEFGSAWYGGDAWVSIFAKVIYEQVRRSHAGSGHIDDALMTTMARSCAQLKTVAAQLAH